MDSRQGYTIEPTLSYAENGEECVSGFEAYDTHGGGEYYPPTPDEYQRFSDEYDFSDDPEFFDQSDDDGYMAALEAQYTDTLFEAYPTLAQAIEWAGEWMDSELIDQYNAAIDSGDFDLMNEAIENLLAFYENESDFTHAEEYELDQEFDESEPEDNDLNDSMETINILLSNGVTEDELEAALAVLRRG